MFHTDADEPEPLDEHESPNEPKDPAVEALIRAYARSERRRADVAWAALGEPPAAADLDALARGRIEDPARREALARQLLAGPLDRGLEWLAHAPAVGTEAPRGRVLALGMAGALRLAAAALVLVAAGVSLSLDLGSAAPRLDVRVTDAHGLEMRSAAPTSGVLRRILVEPAQDGWVALARQTPQGLVVEPVDGPRRAFAVAAGEEVLVPLDRGILVETPGERWFVWTGSGAPPALAPDEFDERFLRALRGGAARGETLATVVVAR